MSGDPSKLCADCGRPRHAHEDGRGRPRPDARCREYRPLGWAGVMRLQARGKLPR